MVSRERLAIVAASLIFSSTLTLLIAVSRSVETFTQLVELEFPDKVFSESLHTSVLHGLVVTRKPTRYLDILFYCLPSRPPTWINSTSLSGREDVARSILQVKNKMDLCEMLGLEYRKIDGLPAIYAGRTYLIDLYDFSVLNDLAHFMGRNKTTLVAEAIGFNSTTGQPELFFEGEADFFWQKGRTLEKLEIRIGDNLMTYYPDEITDMWPQYDSISGDAPYGKIALNDLPAESRIEVTIHIKRAPAEGIPASNLMLIGISVMANGFAEEEWLTIAEIGG